MIPPIYIHLVIWGERFRHYLLEYCLPNLMSPSNIPTLKNKTDNKFLICTTSDDWEVIARHSITSQLKAHMEIVFIEIPPQPKHKTPCQHMGLGHQLATDRCYQDKAIGIAITPDLILSDGSLQFIEAQAEAGCEVLLCPAIRFAEEPLFEEIEAFRKAHPGDSLNIPSNTMVKMAMNAFHSETNSYDYRGPHYGFDAPVTLQKIEQEGLLIHSLSWCPLLLDYSKIQNHNTSCLEQWTMDGDYVHQNFVNQKIKISTDSDEIVLISWAPLSYNAVKVYHSFLKNTFLKFRMLINKLAVRNTLKNPLFDPLKVKLFYRPVYWHCQSMSAKWKETEKNFLNDLNQKHPILDLLFSCYRFIIRTTRTLMGYLSVITKACLNDTDSKQRVINRIQKIMNKENYGSH